MANYEINDIYDIATAFITDKNTTIEFNNDGTSYTFLKRGLADYPYGLTIYAEHAAPRISSFGDRIEHHGTITVHRGTSSNYARELLGYRTKHEVGSALDKTQCDLKRAITRLKSRKFFKIVDLAEKRIAGKIETTDNSKQIFDMMFRLKENQK